MNAPTFRNTAEVLNGQKDSLFPPEILNARASSFFKLSRKRGRQVTMAAGKRADGASSEKRPEEAQRASFYIRIYFRLGPVL